jgi:hypothetical protein
MHETEETVDMDGDELTAELPELPKKGKKAG